MSRTLSKSQLLAAERREQIAAACLDDIAEHGFDHVTMAGIARRVGLTRARIYTYFDTRDELIEYAIADELARILGEVSVLLDHGDDARETMVVTFAYLYRRLADHPVMDQLLNGERTRLMAHLRGDTPETIATAQAIIVEELRLLSDRTSTPLDAEGGAEFMIRAWLSLLVSPQLGSDLSEPGEVEAVARRWLLPGTFGD
jgi:AcrR family transcriptional regulator